MTVLPSNPDRLALRLSSAAPAQTVDSDDLDSTVPLDGLIWIHMNITLPENQSWILHEAGLPVHVAEAMAETTSRPRAVTLPDGLLVILRGVNHNSNNRPDDMVSIRVWVEPHRVITCAHRPLRSVTRLIESAQSPMADDNAANFLIALMEKLGDGIEDFVDAVEARVATAEQQVADNEVQQDYRQRMSHLRRQMASARRYLSPQRDALERLYRDDSQILGQSARAALREELERLMRQLEDLELARERALVAQEEYLGLIAIEQNSRIYLLSVVAAIFLPLTFVTGLLGMNVGGIPWPETHEAFLWVSAGCAVFGLVLLALFRWLRWI